ncbi:hypothetical protein EJB05_48054, partial [Eragrostis curvula]
MHRAPPLQWAELPGDALGEIAGHLGDATDLVRFHAVCRPWRKAPAPPAHRLLPWLIAGPISEFRPGLPIRSPFTKRSLYRRRAPDLRLRKLECADGGTVRVMETGPGWGALSSASLPAAVPAPSPVSLSTANPARTSASLSSPPPAPPTTRRLPCPDNTPTTITPGNPTTRAPTTITEAIPPYCQDELDYEDEVGESPIDKTTQVRPAQDSTPDLRADAAPAQAETAILAAFTPPRVLLRGECSKDGDRAVFIPPLSPAGYERPAPARTEAPHRLKSVVRVPSPRRGPAHSRLGARGAPSAGHDLSQEWQVVKPRHWWRKRSAPSSDGELLRGVARPHNGHGRAPPASGYKKLMLGRCFRCLAKDHRVAQCRDPPRCLACWNSGHFARQCKNPPKPPPIHSRLVFPPDNIHSRISYPPLPARQAPAPVPGQASSTKKPASSPPSQEMEQVYVAGRPHQRPAQGHATVVSTAVMTAELEKLRHQAIVLSIRGHGYQPQVEDVARALHGQLRIPVFNIRVTRHQPQDFFAFFDHPNQRDLAVRRGYIEVAGTRLDIEPWRYVVENPHTWWYRVKIVIEHLPLHAWNEDAFRQLLGDICLFDRMDDSTHTQEVTDLFSCFAWMWNPDLLPRSKLATFFFEGAGRVPRRRGPVPPDEVAPPPEGDFTEVLIHLPYYHNWKPPLSPAPSSGVSGLPSSSSGSGAPFPDFQEFVWHRGILDGRAPPRRPRADVPCRGVDLRSARRDRDDPDDDYRGGRRDGHRSWAENINARGRPADDLPRQLRDGGRYRTRSPMPHRRYDDYNDYGNNGRGRGLSRSPARDRRRDLLPHADDNWERRRSRSPAARHLPAKWGHDADFKAAGHGSREDGGIPEGRDRSRASEICNDNLPSAAFHSRWELDPMLQEFEIAGSTVSTSPSAVSPPYVPVSAEWAGGAVQDGPGVEEGPSLGPLSPRYTTTSPAWDLGPTDADRIFGPGSTEPEPPASLTDQLATQVNEMVIDDMAQAQDSAEDFMDQMFPEIGTPALPDPVRPPPRRPRVRSVSAEPARRSTRQAQIKSVVPVAHRATHRLIKELDLAGDDK